MEQNRIRKYSRYQDYVIRDGRLVGDFETMYQEWEDPWEQSTREAFATDKAMALNAIMALNPHSVIELGCGLGGFTKKIKDIGIANVVGVDISSTAVEKARKHALGCKFEVGDILDFHLYEEHKPEIIVMAEITWYILEKLETFLRYLRENMPNVYLIHLLNTYPKGEQKYGKEYFTDLESILKYFGMNYLEFGQITKPHHGNCSRTYFLGCYGKNEPARL